MIRKFPLILLACLFLNFQTFAQTTLNLALKAGLLRGEEIIKSKNISSYDRGTYEDNANSNLSLALSLPITAKFRLGAEFGLLSFRTFLDYNLTYTNNATERFQGRYKINQAFVAFVPEYRFTHWLYFNSGAGLYSDFNSHFTSGDRTLDGNSSSLIGLEYKRKNVFGYFFSAGICPNITKEIAVLGEVRFTGSPVGNQIIDNIGIGYYAFNFNIGLMYKPKL